VKLHMYSFMHVHIHIPQALSGSKRAVIPSSIPLCQSDGGANPSPLVSKWLLGLLAYCKLWGGTHRAKRFSLVPMENRLSAQGPNKDDETCICARCPVKLRKLRQLETERSENQQNRMDLAEAKQWLHGGSHHGCMHPKSKKVPARLLRRL